MLIGRYKSYTIEKPVEVRDSYNHYRVTFEEVGSALLSLVVQDRTNINNNDMALYQTALVAYTQNKEIDRGWRIDHKYIVRTTVPHRTANILYLEEVEDGRERNNG